MLGTGSLPTTVKKTFRSYATASTVFGRHRPARNFRYPPVTALAADQVTGGYWVLKSHGGVYNYNAPRHGSVAGKVPAGLTVTAISAG